MDSILSVRPEGSPFPSVAEAESFFRTRNFSAFSKGSTEEHEEYRILEIRGNRLYFPNSSAPIRRTASSKNGEFVSITDGSGATQIGIETEHGLEYITWEDKP